MMARDPGRPRVPNVAEEICAQPGRFLTFAPALVLARIRGIDRIDTARELLIDELEIGEDLPDGPRSAIVSALHRRMQELQEHGERDNEHQQRRENEPSLNCTRSLIWRNGGDRRSGQPAVGEFYDRGGEQ